MTLTEYIKINTKVFVQSWKVNPVTRAKYKGNVVSYIATLIDKTGRNLNLDKISPEELVVWGKDLYTKLK